MGIPKDYLAPASAPSSGTLIINNLKDTPIERAGIRIHDLVPASPKYYCQSRIDSRNNCRLPWAG